MAAQSEGGGKDDIKTQFMTREGTYKLMTLSEYTRPNRVAYNGGTPNTPVRVSFVQLPDASGCGERICFNIGRELYFYMYKGVRKAADLTKPIDKRVYKGTFPTCHDFNTFTAKPDSLMLLIGFTGGQVQLIDPITKELCKLYNEEKLIDKSKVTCIKWVPASSNQFLVSHASGQMYVYNEELPCGATSPHYQLFKQGEGFSVHTCKTKSTRNPLYRWVIGEGAINEFEFSPCSKYLAVVSQDGYLRVINYNSMDLVGTMKSYFGGLLCCCWSPDGKFIVTGGEDDLVTVWSFHDKKVICRGQGHKSWVNAVAFDPYTTSIGDCDSIDLCGSDEDFTQHGTSWRGNPLLRDALRNSTRSNGSSKSGGRYSMDSKSLAGYTSYRFASVSQDTVLCLWDLTEDMIRQPIARTRTSTFIPPSQYPNSTSTSSTSLPRCNSIDQNLIPNNTHNNSRGPSPVSDGQVHHTTVSTSLTHKFATLALGDRKDKDDKKSHKRNLSSLTNRSNHDKVSLSKGNNIKPQDDAIRLLGTPACPRLQDITVMDPLVCKKIAHERLTALAFREECMVTCCQEGYVCTWARPGKVQNQLSSVSPTSM